MAPKKRFQIKSECPECGCGLICNMTPDEYREKHGETKGKKIVVCCKDCGVEHEATVTEE